MCIVQGKYMYVWGSVHARAHCYDVYKRGMSVRSPKDVSGLLMGWSARFSSAALPSYLVASFPSFRLSVFGSLVIHLLMSIFYLSCIFLSLFFFYLFFFFVSHTLHTLSLPSFLLFLIRVSKRQCEKER